MRILNGRNPFSFVSGRSRADDLLVRYLLREHAHGRPVAAILDDPYVRNRSTPDERRRLLDRPEVVRVLGENALEELRQALPAA